MLENECVVWQHCQLTWSLSLCSLLFLNMHFLSAGLCLEKRVFYRLISGLHSSINIHLCGDHLLDGTTLSNISPISRALEYLAFCFLRGVGTISLGSRPPGVQTAFWHGGDQRWGHTASEEPVLPVPDRAAGALQSGAVLWASDRQPLHRKQSGGSSHQRAAAGAAQRDQVRTHSNPGTSSLTCGWYPRAEVCRHSSGYLVVVMWAFPSHLHSKLRI